MKRLKLLLLDANIVIQLFELGLWDKVVSQCEILLSRIVAEQEATYFECGDHQERIDLDTDVAQGCIRIVDVTPCDLAVFKGKFDPTYFERLDPGETESLVYLECSADPCLICSADTIVFKVMAILGRSDQAISLEEILSKVGLGCGLPDQYTKSFKDRWLAKGSEDMIRGIGLK